MSRVDWSLAPKWADRVVVGPISGRQYWANEERRIQFGGGFDPKDDNHIREGWTTTEFKPKPWSGPEDGLPPISTLCQYWNGGWEKCLVIAHLNGRVAFTCPDDTDNERVYIESSPLQHQFKAIKTQKQLAADKRETAIREMAKVLPSAKHECYTFNADGSVKPYATTHEILGLLVDAGFKR